MNLNELIEYPEKIDPTTRDTCKVEFACAFNQALSETHKLNDRVIDVGKIADKLIKGFRKRFVIKCSDGEILKDVEPSKVESYLRTAIAEGMKEVVKGDPTP